MECKEFNYFRAASMAYLTEPVPDDWDDWTLEKQCRFCVEHVWAPLEGTDGNELIDLIDAHADTIKECSIGVDKTYSHMFTLAFEVNNSPHEDGEAIEAHEIRDAILSRIVQLDNSEDPTYAWLEATGLPEDTHEE